MMVQNIVTEHVTLPVAGAPVDYHYYTRYIKRASELWCFTCGMGEQTIMEGLGQAFLSMPDPKLGRIVLALGGDVVAQKPFRGDFNVWWAYANSDTFVSEYLASATVKPDLAVACSRKLFGALISEGLETLLLPLGVNASFFKPLHLPRKGIGFAGAAKNAEQTRLMLAPFIGNELFEWHGRNASDPWFTLIQLNEWYNTKQIVLGLNSTLSEKWHLVPNRVFESYASGTPLVLPRHPGFREVFGFEQPYAADKEGDCKRFVDEIMDDYSSVQSRFEELGRLTREKHDYTERLNVLFHRIMEMKR